MGAPKRLKVYGWDSSNYVLGTRYECPNAPHHRQVRAAVAAPSMAAVGRIMDMAPHEFFNLGETWNAESIEVAMAAPGTVFVKCLSCGGQLPWISCGRGGVGDD